MAYNNNIPLATQDQSQSQPQIRDNFAEISTIISVDHVGFNTGDQGKHNKVTFPVQGSSPSFSSGEDGLYNKLFVTTNKNELYIHKQTASGTSEIPMTASILSLSTPSLGIAGWTYLPSGILMRWVNFTGSGLVTVTLPTSGFQPFITIYSIIVSPFSSSTSDDNFAVRLVSIDSATQFKVYISSRTSTGAASGGVQGLIIGR